MKKVLILHTSEGYGPKVVAENIGEYLKANTPWEVRVVDALETERGAVVEAARGVYFQIYRRFSFLWGLIYQTKLIHNPFVFRFRYLLALKGKKVLKIIADFHPDIIISTQTYASAIAAHAMRAGLWQGTLGIVFSDYHFHSFWVYPEADFFCCVTELEKQKLLDLGVAENKILQIGIPIHGKFFQSFDKTAARGSFGLPPRGQKVVTLTGGRRGLQTSLAVARSLEDLPIHLVVICGRNEALQKRMEDLRSMWGNRLTVLGFVENMEGLLAATDILISKPGGPTVSEAAAVGVPVILTDAHPGHEMENYKYLTASRFAVGARNPQEVVRAVKNLLDNQEAANEQIARAKTLVHPNALAQIKNFLDNISN